MKNKFNDYSGISEKVDDDISRHYVLGDGNCFFRSLYLAILYNDIKNFRKINLEIRPQTVVIKKNDYSDINEFADLCRKYISKNYDSILNNIIEMGYSLEDDDIYPNSQDALFGEAGNCYIKYRGKDHVFKENEVVDVNRNGKWIESTILEISNVSDDESSSNDDSEESVYKIQYNDNDEIEENVLQNRMMKKGRVHKFFKCAKKQILNNSIYPTYGEIDLITNLLNDSFEIRNIILPSMYNIQVKNSEKIINNIGIKDIVDKYGNVQNSFNRNDSVMFRKSKFLKGKIVEKTDDNLLYTIQTKSKMFKNIGLKNIQTRENVNKKEYYIGEKILFREPFRKGKIVDVISDSTMNEHLLEKSKEKIKNDIERYESQKDTTKTQIYLLTDEIHYNYIAIENDDLKRLDLSKDGNFTNNLLNYLDENENKFSDISSYESDDSNSVEFDYLKTKSCEKCGSDIIGDKYFKTKNLNKETRKIETIYFCCMNCFRNYENWRKK